MVWSRALALLGLLVSAGARADLDVTVTGGEVGATPIAIVPFGDPSNVGYDFAKIIDADLGSTGQFRTLARGDMLEKPTQPSEINYANWRALNMDNLVVGQVRRDPSGKIAVRFYLMDAIRGQQLAAYDMPLAQPDQLRYLAHQIANLIYEKLTGTKGAFNTKIAYVVSSGIGVTRRFALVISDYDGFAPHVVVTSHEPLMSPAWSPDARQLAFVGYERDRQAIYLLTIATGQVRKLVSEKGINGSPAFSPDGSKLAITLSFETNPDIYVIDLASGARHRLTDLYSIDTEPSWSPDGQSLVFTSDRGGQPQIYQMSAAGGDAKRITFQGKQNLHASYSPDGKTLALVNMDGGVYRVGLLDLASGALTTLTDGPLDESPSFSPNGAVIIYATAGGQGAELATISVDGRVKRRMRQPGGDVSDPAWSPLPR